MANIKLIIFVFGAFAVVCLFIITCTVIENTHVLHQNQARSAFASDQALAAQIIDNGASLLAWDEMEVREGKPGAEAKLAEDERRINQAIKEIAHQSNTDMIEG